MTIDIISEFAEVFSLKDAWCSLLDRAVNNNLFLSWEWNYYWCLNLVSEDQLPFIIVAKENDRCIGIAPLLIDSQYKSSKSIQFLTQPYSYHLGFIAEKGKEELVYNCFWDILLKLVNSKSHQIQFIHLDDNTILYNTLKKQSEKLGLSFELGSQNPCKVLDLPDNYTNYLKSGIHSENLRKNILKDLRHLDKEYHFEFFLAAASDFQNYFDELLRLHREMMRIRNKSSVLLGEKFPLLLNQITEIASKNHNLRLCVLKVNNETAAVLLGIIYKNVFNALTIGVNQQMIIKFPWLNITNLAHVIGIKTAIEGNCIQFDFGGGRHDYKYKLGGKDTGGVKITINPPEDKHPIAIITHAFLNTKQNDGINIGGVETWLLELIRLLIKMGFAPIVYQTSEKAFRTNFEGAEIIGFGEMDRDKLTELSHKDIDKRSIQPIIYACSFVGVKNFRPGNIFIQHGIHWDYTTSATNFRLRLKWEYIRWKLSRNDLKKSSKSRLTITVDSNYLNYARTMLHHKFDPLRIRYIPNFAIPQDPEGWLEKWDNPDIVNVVFARRFEMRRGVLIFAEAMDKILLSSAKIHVTFAGCGSFEPFVRERFGNNPRITIEEIPHDRIYGLLQKSHIAVIPSTYSEGTSLSCLEAMASGCAVIATDIGGLCNIVIPDFNGLLIRPIASDIVSAINQLVNNIEMAKSFSKRGHEMIVNSFSLEIWQKRIREALTELQLADNNPNK